MKCGDLVRHLARYGCYLKREGKEHSLLYGEDGRHIYGGAVSPDGRYLLFTRSLTDGNEDTAVLSLMRFSDAPIIAAESKALRKLLLLPASVVFAALGLLCAYAGRRRRRVNVFAN